jgi:hypothetical protein
MNRSGNAKDRAGSQRAHGRGSKDAPIECNVIRTRELTWHEREHDTRPERRQSDTGRGAEQSERQILDHQLASKSRRTSAQRSANGELSPSRTRPRDQQIGNIDARDDEDERDGAE